MSPLHLPPARYDGTPHTYLLPAYTRVTRIHSARYAVTSFNPRPAKNRYRGGRFDATPDDPYSFLYAALDDAVAVSEALLRDVPFDERGTRLLPRAALTDKRIGWLRTIVDLELTDLRSGKALAAIGADSRLITAIDYEVTRRWSAAIRAWVPHSAGLIWRSYREPAGYAMILFGDRCPSGALAEVNDALPVPAGNRQLDAGPGHLYVREILARYRTTLG